MKVDAYDADWLLLVFALVALGACAFLGLGCAGPFRVAATAERRVGDRPCLTTLPTKPKLRGLADPERVPYIAPDGEARVAMRLLLDAESAGAFFNYVESLEKVAQKALGCTIR